MRKRARKQSARATFIIRTDHGTRKYDLAREPEELSEFRQGLELDTSKEPESIVHIGDWVWVQYEKENGELDNNLALAVAILVYSNGRMDVAILWGKETQAGWNAEPHRVVCTDDLGIVEKDTIGGRVVEPEGCGRIVTENSDGEEFSLDRYHISSSSSNGLQRFESISFETWSGRPPKRFLQEMELVERAPTSDHLQEYPNLPVASTMQAQAKTQNGRPLRKSTPDKQVAAVLEPGPEPEVLKENEAYTGKDTGVGTGLDKEETAGRDFATHAKTAIQAHTDADTAVEVEADTAADTAVDAVAYAEAYTDRDIEFDAEPDTDAAPDADAERAVEPIAELIAEAGADPVEPIAEANAERAIEPSAEPVAGSISESDAKSDVKSDHEVDTDVPTDGRRTTDTAEPEPRTKSGSDQGANPDTAPDTGVGAKSKGMSMKVGAKSSRGDRQAECMESAFKGWRSLKRIRGAETSVDKPSKKAKTIPSPTSLGVKDRASSASNMTTKIARASSISQKLKLVSSTEDDVEKEQTEKQVLYIRHKLQRCFLMSNSSPTESQLSTAANLIRWLEARPNMAWSIISESKINTAIRKIRDLSIVPGEEKHCFGERCAKLLAAWKTQSVREARPKDGGTSKGDNVDSGADTNRVVAR